MCLPTSFLCAVRKAPSSPRLLPRVPLCVDDAEESLSPERRLALGGSWSRSLRVVEARGSDTSRWASGVELLKGLEELWPDEGTVPALGGSPSSFSCLPCDVTLGICLEESDWTDRSPAPLAGWPDRSVLAWVKSPPAESRLSPVRRVSVGR